MKKVLTSFSKTVIKH